MQAVLIIPTYDRPEMLWLCLDHLVDCPEIAGIPIKVYVDAHQHKPQPPLSEIHYVCEQFPTLRMTVETREAHPYVGNSYNVLEALREAAQTGVDRVYMVEDDVVVQPFFFQWHEEVHRVLHPVCSIGVSVTPYGGYASLGVCFRRDWLAQAQRHFTPAYYGAMRDYCVQHFPKSRFECEQDGLLARVLEQGEPQTVVWAAPPVAQHVGWYGYHRGRSQRPVGDILTKYYLVREVLRNDATLQRWEKDFHDVRSLEHFYPTGFKAKRISTTRADCVPAPEPLE